MKNQEEKESNHRCKIIMSASATQGGDNKDQLSLTNPRDALHHGKWQNLTTVT